MIPPFRNCYNLENVNEIHQRLLKGTDLFAKSSVFVECRHLVKKLNVLFIYSAHHVFFMQNDPSVNMPIALQIRI